MIYDGLYQRLRDDAGVAALVGDRIWPLVIPQSDRGQQRQPCIVYQLISRGRQSTYCATAAVVESQYQIDAYGTTYNSAKAVAAALVGCLLDFRGLLGGYRVHNINLVSELELQDPEPGLYRVNHTFAIWHGTEPQA